MLSREPPLFRQSPDYSAQVEGTEVIITRPTPLPVTVLCNLSPQGTEPTPQRFETHLGLEHL